MFLQQNFQMAKHGSPLRHSNIKIYESNYFFWKMLDIHFSPMGCFRIHSFSTFFLFLFCTFLSSYIQVHTFMWPNHLLQSLTILKCLKPATFLSVLTKKSVLLYTQNYERPKIEGFIMNKFLIFNMILLQRSISFQVKLILHFFECPMLSGSFSQIKLT